MGNCLFVNHRVKPTTPSPSQQPAATNQGVELKLFKPSDFDSPPITPSPSKSTTIQIHSDTPPIESSPPSQDLLQSQYSRSISIPIEDYKSYHSISSNPKLIQIFGKPKLKWTSQTTMDMVKFMDQEH